MDLTPAEQLLYSTIRLASVKNNVVSSFGTGFFIYFTDGNNIYPAIVTNKHVINGFDSVVAVCHVAKDDKPSGEFVECRIDLTHPFLVPHPDPMIDLCAILFGSMIQQAASNGRPLFIIPLGVGLIPTGDAWSDFDAIEDVVMVGCPNGIYDQSSNTPIVRRGITASPLFNRYNGRDEFVVDIACFPGSSGSPIFIFDKNGYYNKKTKTQFMGQSRLIFIGVLYAGPQILNNGDVILAAPPKAVVPSMMHLGFAIRASALLPLRDAVLKHIAGLSAAKP